MQINSPLRVDVLAGRKVKVALSLNLLNLLGVGGDQAGFGRAGDDLDMDVVLAGKEQSLADRELAEALFLLAGQLEDVSPARRPPTATA